MRAWERPLDLLEAAYRLDGRDDEWMQGLVRTAARVFAREDLGTAGFIVSGRVDPAGRTVIARTGNFYIAGLADAGAREGRRALRAYPGLAPELQENLFFSADTASTVSVRTGLGARLQTDPHWRKSGWDVSVTADSLGLTCHDGPLHAAVLGVGLREETVLKRPEKSLLRRVATHIGAAFRLRRVKGGTYDRADAVLTPTGNVQHLANDADRAMLTDGLARRGHARRRDVAPEAALDVWQGLIDGRWSLVDHLDTDGKAFVLAVRNEPARDITAALTDRQRAVVALATLGYGNKAIAYALGLSQAAVAMLLARARSATGVRTRAELTRAFKRCLAESA